MRVLLAGESWVTHSVHVKGVDSFDTRTYVEGAGRLIDALRAAHLEVDYLPGHLVPPRFPGTAAELAAYGAVILSDIGANSLLLAPQTFERSVAAPNRLAAVEQYVRDGGGLLMIGGYLSFAGIEGKARYHDTPVEIALPVTVSPHDDRAERPEGVHPAVTEPGHPVLADVPQDWPALLGYNQLTARLREFAARMDDFGRELLNAIENAAMLTPPQQPPTHVQQSVVEEPRRRAF